MAPDYSNNPYASNFAIGDDGSVAFSCSPDADALAWLTLPPHHPVVIQTQAFWTAVGGSIALQGMEATQWSALTWIDWELGEGTGGHAVSGVYRREEVDEKASYEIELFNSSGAAIVTIHGRGVVFRNRNFEDWRAGSKAQARNASLGKDFAYTDRASLGLTQQECVLVAPFDPQTGFVDALIDARNGFPPGNPLIGGSGDHVNSPHFHEAARQALFLIKGRTDIDTSGEMTLKRYVELGTPFRLNIIREEDNRIELELEQLGKLCAQITLRWQPA